MLQVNYCGLQAFSHPSNASRIIIYYHTMSFPMNYSAHMPEEKERQSLCLDNALCFDATNESIELSHQLQSKFFLLTNRRKNVSKWHEEKIAEDFSLARLFSLAVINCELQWNQLGNARGFVLSLRCDRSLDEVACCAFGVVLPIKLICCDANHHVPSQGNRRKRLHSSAARSNQHCCPIAS